MPRIDLIGAPGCGKSSLISALAERRSENGLSFLTSMELKRYIANRLFVESPKRRWLKKTIIGFPSIQRFIEPYVISAAVKHATRDHIENWQPFLDDYLRSMLQHSKPDPWTILVRMRRVMDRLELVALYEKHASDEVFVWDSSLTQYCKKPEHVPPPDAVVHVRCDVDETVRRIGYRFAAGGYTVPEHRTSTEQLRKIVKGTADTQARSADVLRTRGVDVITVDVTDGTTAASRMIEGFIISLS